MTSNSKVSAKYDYILIPKSVKCKNLLKFIRFKILNYNSSHI